MMTQSLLPLMTRNGSEHHANLFETPDYYPTLANLSSKYTANTTNRVLFTVRTLSSTHTGSFRDHRSPRAVFGHTHFKATLFTAGLYTARTRLLASETK